MYSELFDQLGRGGGRGAGGNNNDSPPEEPPLLQFKAGRMNLEKKRKATSTDETEPETTANTYYNCTSDTARGEVRIVVNDTNNKLQWQWYDRRNDIVKDRHTIETSSQLQHTFTKVIPNNNTSSSEGTGTGKNSKDRLYVWTTYKGEENKDDDAEYKMYWMQDADETKDEEIVEKINEYFKDPMKAIRDHNGDTSATAGAGTAGAGTSNANNQQVDALSSILENLGMPQTATSSTSSDNNAMTTDNAASASSAPAAAANATASGTAAALTLADLQGAMAQVQQQQQTTASTAPPIQLQDVVLAKEAVESIFNDDAAKSRLLELLPENHRTDEQLRETLQSPQIAATLRSLTQAIYPDHDDNNGNPDWSGYASVLANFQLNPNQDGSTPPIPTPNDPVASFLQCVLQKVQQEQGDKDKDEEDADKQEAEEKEGDETKPDDKDEQEGDKKDE